MRRRHLSLIFLFLSNISANAAIDIGAGVGGATAGRTNLAIVLALESSDSAFVGYISGVETSYYYQSDYFLSYNKKIVMSDFLWGSLNGYVGGGTFYSKRGLRTTATGDLTEDVSDVLAGPTLHIKWSFLGPGYVALDAIYGLRSPLAHIMLSFQDVEVLSLGFSF